MVERPHGEFEIHFDVQARVKISFGLVHMEAARDFAKKCAAIENSQRNQQWPKPRLREAASFALGAVILSVAAIEAGINDTYLDAVDDAEDADRGRPQAKPKLLAELWHD